MRVSVHKSTPEYLERMIQNSVMMRSYQKVSLKLRVLLLRARYLMRPPTAEAAHLPLLKECSQTHSRSFKQPV